jgi:two-component system KDP operon response regulator KdpE
MSLSGDPSPGKILVTDDEPQIRRFLRIALRSQGYEVLEAATAAEGIAQVATGTPDLVVLDLGLPDADGKAVLAEVRGWARVPVLILSVRSAEAEKVQALDGGASDYVTKPFGIQEFLAGYGACCVIAPHRAANPRRCRSSDGHLRIDLTTPGQPGANICLT